MLVLVLLNMIQYVSPKLTVVAIIPLLVITVGDFFYGKAMHKRFKAKQEAFSGLTDQVQETISGIRVIKAFANEKRSTDTFKTYNKEWLKTDIKASRITTLFPNIVGFVVTLIEVKVFALI